MTDVIRETFNGIMPPDKIPYQIYTDPAVRAVGSLRQSERAYFNGLRDGAAQEEFLISRWAKLQDRISLARHNAARALQAIAELALQEDFTGTVEVRRSFPLGSALDVSSGAHDGYLRMTESEFIKGFNGLWEQITSQPSVLDIVEPGKPNVEYRDQRACYFAPSVGCLSVSRAFDRAEVLDENNAVIGVTLPYNSEFAFMRTTEVDPI